MFLVSTLSDGSDRILLCEFAEVICKQSVLIVLKKVQNVCLKDENRRQL